MLTVLKFLTRNTLESLFSHLFFLSNYVFSQNDKKNKKREEIGFCRNERVRFRADFALIRLLIHFALIMT